MTIPNDEQLENKAIDLKDKLQLIAREGMEFGLHPDRVKKSRELLKFFQSVEDLRGFIPPAEKFLFREEKIWDSFRLAKGEGVPREKPPTRKLIPAHQIQEIPKPEYLIRELHIPENDLCCLFGASGSGKSWVAGDLACTVAQTGTVVYVAAEAVGTYSTRLAAWEKMHKLPLDNLFFWPDAIDLLDKTSIAAFIDEVSDLKPKLVVIDTLARCMPGADENSAKDMGLAVANLDTIRRATSATVLVVHHTGKNGIDERGSTALRGACSLMVKLQNDDDLISLRCEKSRMSAGFEELQFRLIGTGDEMVLLAANRVDLRNAPLTESLLKSLQIIQDWPHSEGLRLNDLATTAGINPGTAFKQISRLKKQGYIEEIKKYFKLSLKGQLILESSVLEDNSGDPEPLNHSTLNWKIKSNSDQVKSGGFFARFLPPTKDESLPDFAGKSSNLPQVCPDFADDFASEGKFFATPSLYRERGAKSRQTLPGEK